MNGNQQKIPVGVFRDLLVSSSKSIRSIALPDTIYKINKDSGHLNPDYEFLSFDSQMELLLDTNPLLQEIEFLSSTTNNQ